MTSPDARRLASALQRRGLVAPARLLADAHRPIGPLLADLGAALGQLLGATGAAGADRLLSEPRVLDDVLDALGEREPPRARPD